MPGLHTAEVEYLASNILCAQMADGEHPNFVAREFVTFGYVADVARRFFSQNQQQHRILSHKIPGAFCIGLRLLNEDGSINASVLTQEIQQMEHNHVIPIYIATQNTGLFLRRVDNDTVLEAFGVTTHSRNIFKTSGSLQRSFPSHAYQFSPKSIHSQGWAQGFSEFVHEASVDCIDYAVERSYRRDGSEIVELRQKTKPGPFIEMLSSIISKDAMEIEPVRITKRLRDEANHKDSKLPFRRSATYNFARIFFQLEAHHADLEDKKSVVYKKFMLFLTSDLLGLCVEHDLPGDVVLIGMRRLLRKSEKLGFTSQQMQHAIVRARTYLQFHWPPRKLRDSELADTMTNAYQHSNFIDTLANDRDRPQVFSKLRKHILEEINRYGVGVNVPYTTLDEHQNLQLDLDFDGVPSLRNFKKTDTLSLMLEIEMWVEQEMPRLTFTSNTNLGKLGVQYFESAKGLYKGLSEQTGIMFLTAFEVWVIVDKLAIRSCKLLKDYDPEIPPNLLKHLVLKGRPELERLRILEQYIDSRRRNANPRNPSHFSKISRRSFPVQFFNTSPELKQIEAQIEARVKADCKEKYRELEEKERNAPFYKAKYKDMLHETFKKEDGNDCCHDFCEACKVQSHFFINLYEKPLPTDTNQRKFALFELGLPSSFSAYRDLTWKLLASGKGEPVLGEEVFRTLAPMPSLKVVEGLRNVSTSYGQTMTGASPIKPYCATHYKAVEVPLEQNDLIRDCGLEFELASGPSTWIADQTREPSLLSLCAPPLLTGPYEALQDAANTTGLSSEEILANKTTLPNDLTELECSTFCRVRMNEELQLLNIKHVLSESPESLNLREFWILISQATWEAGTARPDGNALRVSHKLIENDSFAGEFLQAIKKVQIQIVVDSSQERLLSVLILLVLRILSLTLSSNVKREASAILGSLRSEAYRWVQESLHKDENEPKLNVEESNGPSPVLRLAYLCRSTFDADPSEIAEMLDSETGLEVLLNCTILINQNSPVDYKKLPHEFRSAFFRDARLGRKLSKLLAVAATQRPSVMNRIFEQRLRTYQFEDEWTCQSEDTWVQTNATFEGDIEKVKFNTLNGSVSVAGQQYGSLPEKYRHTQTYRFLFGDESLKVVKSPHPEYEFRTWGPVNGKMLYFAFWNDLVVCAGPADGRNFEIAQYIPSRYLQDDLPKNLVDETEAWWDLDKHILYFQSRGHSEPSVATGWSLELDYDGPYLMQHIDGKRLYSMSEFCGAYKGDPVLASHAESLLRIEHPEHIVLYTMNNKYHFGLPRFALSLMINRSNELECKEVRAVVDQDQNIGTLFGLKSRLVLRSIQKCIGAPKRFVLVPKNLNGDVKLHKKPTYNEVDTRPGRNQNTVDWSLYDIDSHLRYLRSRPGDLHGEFFIAYLHAITSGPWKDTWTMRTGLDESLHRLAGKNLYPSTPLSPTLTPLLDKISKITPVRSFYPNTKKDMQRVEWNKDLSRLVQVGDFQVMMSKIIFHSDQLRSLRPTYQEFLATDYEDDAYLLGERARVRSSCIRHHQCREAVTIQDHLYTGTNDGAYADWLEKCKNCRAIMKMIDVGELNDSIPLSDLRGILLPHKPRDIQIKSKGPPSEVDSSTLTPNFSSISEHMEMSISKRWPALYETLRKHNNNSPADRNRLKFLVGPLCFGENEITDVMTIVTMSISGKFADEKMPSHKSYDLLLGIEPDKNELIRILSPYLPAVGNELWREERFTTELRAFVNQLPEHWSDNHLQLPLFPGDPSEWPWLADKQGALEASTSYFQTIIANRSLETHVDRIDRILDSCVVPRGEINHMSGGQRRFWPYKPLQNRQYFSPRSLSSFFQNKPKPIGKRPKIYAPNVEIINDQRAQSSKDELNNVIDSIKTVGTASRANYKSSLSKSFEAFGAVPREMVNEHIPEDALRTIQDSYVAWEARHNCLLDLINAALDNQNEPSGLAPREILGMIASSFAERISKGWKEVILEYAVSITMLQRLERLQNFIYAGNAAEFCKEARNTGNADIDWVDVPRWARWVIADWTLLEIEKGILIRPEQVRFAIAIVSPESKRNVILQAQMGFGKSYVVIPMVVALLSLRSPKLLKIITSKTLLPAMQLNLETSLGGLLGRRVYHTPLDRTFPKTKAAVEKLFAKWEECRKSGGVLVATADDFLNLKLLIFEIICSGDQTGHDLLKTFEYWENNTRNFIDECDETLSPTFQLIYTLGSKAPLDGGRIRYLVPLQLLRLVAKHITEDGEPVNAETCEELLESIVQDIGDGGITSLDLNRVDQKFKYAALDFIQHKQAPEETLKLVLEGFRDDQTSLEILHILRGQLSHGILGNALARQWMVNFGLDLSRTNEAVPYSGRGCPKRSNFGHPDLMILLTCRSWHCEGLTKDQLVSTIQQILKSPDVEEEILHWNNTSQLNMSLKKLKDVCQEVDDEDSKQLISELRCNRALIDYFLAVNVLPEACKQHTKKMSCSDWDMMKPGCLSTTGISGTADNSSLLPSSIEQAYLAEFLHIPAQQLDMLLRQDNRGYISTGLDITVDKVLELLKQQKVEVFIDVGPLVIEMQNKEVARIWLEVDDIAEAVLYFNDTHQAVMLSRDGTSQLLVNSKYNGQLENCRVYIDHIHTRGVDLKLPPYSKAGVSLGPKINLAKVLQGCLRMRLLGSGQTVVFVGPPKIEAEIRKFSDLTTELSSLHVVKWAIEKTLAENEDLMGLWKEQKRAYEHRQQAIQNFLKDSEQDKSDLCHIFSESVIETSSSNLEMMYGSKAQGSSKDLLLEIEVEIELETEQHQEIHVQKSCKLEPLPSILEEDVKDFIRIGSSFNRVHGEWVTAFASFTDTLNRFGVEIDPKVLNRFGNEVDPDPKQSRVFASKDFLKTVKLGPYDSQEEYLEPVHFVLSSVELPDELEKQMMLLISPFECAKWLEDIQASESVHLHVWAPRRMRNPFSSEDPLSTTAFGPPESPVLMDPKLRLELMLRSGTLYMDSKEQFYDFRKFVDDFFTVKKKTSVGPVARKNDPRMKTLMSITKALDRSGKDLGKTDVGRMCDGWEPSEEDFRRGVSLDESNDKGKGLEGEEDLGEGSSNAPKRRKLSAGWCSS